MKLRPLVLLMLLCGPGAVRAADLRLAVPAGFAGDPFVTSFAASRILGGAGLTVTTKPVANDADAIAALNAGEADLGVFALDDAGRRALQASSPEASLLNRPFLFKSAQEVFLMQDSFLGAAAAADAGRGGLFPLRIWSHAIAYLLTRTPVLSAADFRKMRVAAETGAMTAMAKDEADVLETDLDAAARDFTEKFPGKLYLTVGRPETGLLAAAPAFWTQRSEFEKNAVQTAAEQARAAANAVLMAREDAFRHLPNVEVRQLDATTRMRMAAPASGDDTRMSQDMALWHKAEMEVHGSAAPAPAEGPAPKMAMTSPVLFATDRNDEATSDYATRFGARRLNPAEITCGFLGAPERNAPPPPLPPAPKNLDRGIESCARKIVDRTRTAGARKILVLIHGFNTSFSDVAERALELGAGLDYAGAIVAWSWPSEGSAFSYAYDEDSNAWSEPHLAELVTRIAEIAPNIQLDFVAHSMGNRILLQMLREFALEKSKARVGVAVFAAPDIAQDVFREQLRQARKIGALRTLYASEYDRAILISQSYHQAPRAGSGGGDILVAGGVESVDAQLSGHSYVFDEPRAMRDFKQIVNRERTAPERGLPEREKPAGPYWIILP